MSEENQKQPTVDEQNKTMSAENLNQPTVDEQNKTMSAENLNQPTVDEQIKANAEFAKKLYEAYIKAGFNSSQAIKLLIANLSK